MELTLLFFWQLPPALHFHASSSPANAIAVNGEPNTESGGEKLIISIPKKMKILSKILPLLLLLITSSFFSSQAQVGASNQESFTSIIISQTGLDFVKDLLITKAISSIIPLALPKIERAVKIPILGNVRMVLSNITIYNIDVLSSYVKPGDTGVVFVASGTTCNLSANWFYEYTTWLLPIEISDHGIASVQVVYFV